MEITRLPEDVIIIIINMLDTKSVFSLHQTCSRFASICMGNVVKECIFSRNTLANAKSLASNFFLDVAYHLRVLNLCDVQDLTKTLLLPAMKKLKNLKSLDVTYTAITIKDLLDIHKVCPTMKSISINLALTSPKKLLANYSKTEMAGYHETVNLSATAITEYQNMFKHFENVHFVYDYTAWWQRFVCIILTKAHLKSLTGTYSHTSFEFEKWVTQQQDDAKITSDTCESLDLRLMDCLWRQILPNIHFKNTEYLIFGYKMTTDKFKVTTDKFECKVVCSPLLRPFFRENFGINAEDGKIDVITGDQLVVMFWKQDTTVFDDVFFRSLFKKLQPIVPINFMPVTQHSSYRNLIKNWVYLKSHVINSNQEKSIDKPLFKKKRLAPQSVVLDCDAACRGMQDIVLMVDFMTNRHPVTLSSSNAYLQELTKLIIEDIVSYDGDFFKILFRTCNKLVTIDVDLTRSNNSSFSVSVPLSKSLKILRLRARNINFNTFYSGLSQCRSLENIYIDDATIDCTYAYPITELPNPSIIFVNCTNLYNFTFNARWSVKTCLKNLKMMKEIKADLGMHHLNVNVGLRIWRPSQSCYNSFGLIGTYHQGPSDHI